MKLDGCTALITGASAGLGREFARQLAGQAQTLVLVARRQDRLDQLRDELQKLNSKLNVRVRAADISNDLELKMLFDWLDRQQLHVDVLVNNAGLGDAGAFATSDPDRNDEMLLVNMVALTRLTRKFLPEMVARKRGAILNVSSSAGFLPIPDFAVYAATKAYVTSFSEALRAELLNVGVSVTALCPGPVHTEFGDIAKRPGDQPRTAPDFVYVSAENVVRETLNAVEANTPILVPGFVMKLAMFLTRITPMFVLRFFWRFGLRRSTR